jgi:hypothetical protein
MSSPKIRFKRSSVPNRKPTVSGLPLGEIAINTFDGEVYIARERAGIGTDIVRVGAGATVINVLYVTQDGNDNNTGKKLGDAKRTIKSAVAESFPGTVIKVSAGIYLEDNPIILPNNVSIVGDSLREVTVTPKNKGDLFWLDNGVYIAEMSFIGPPNPDGAIVTFNPEIVPYIDQSPYIQNCTNFIPGSIGLNINGKHAIGPIKSMVLDSYTQINPGGLGARIFNEAFAQLVSMFTICSGTAILCESGGACDLTNSNSSFGNFGLVADGVGPLKYVGVVSETTGPDARDITIDIGANTPEMNVIDAEYDHVTGIAKFVLDREHNISVGMGLTIAGLGFTCDSDGGEVELIYPSGNKGYIFEARTVAPGRYVDASESIQANRTEILDKSLASIALFHPDFFFPGEDRTNSSSRFYDSYRLIQQNKQEIVDKSLAEIALQYPDFVFPNDEETNARSRFFDSYRLIQQNRQEVIDKSLASISLEHPKFFFPDTSRNRFKDAFNLINDNEAELIDKSLATISLYHSNFFFPDDDETNARSRFFDSYRLIIQNKQEIVDKSLAAVSLEYDQYPNFFFPDDDETNARSRFFDAYRLIQKNRQEIIDKSLASIALRFENFFFPGDEETNERSRFFDAYRLIQQNKQEIVDKSLAAIALEYDQYPEFFFPGDDETTSRSRFFDAYRLIQQNRQEVVDKSLATISLNYALYPEFFFPGDDETTERSRFFDSYRLIQQNRQEIIDKSIGGIALLYEEYPSEWAFPGDDTTNDRSRFYDSYRLIQKNRQQIIDTAWTSTRNQFPAIQSTETKCRRDIGFFIDAISTDILTGGNSYSQDFVLQYFVSGAPISNGLVGEETESVFAFNQARNLMGSAITNQLNFKDLDITADPETGSNTSVDSCVNVKSTIDNLVDIVTTSISAGNTNNLGTRNTGIFDQSKEPSEDTPGGFKCARDIGFLVDAISTDVFTGGNSYSREFILQYFDANGDPLLDGLYEEEVQSLNGFVAAREFIKKALTNQLNNKDLTLTAGPAQFGGSGGNIPVDQSGNSNSCQDVQDNVDTLVGIVTSVVGLGTTANVSDVTSDVNFGYFNLSGIGTTSSPGGFKCARDIGFLVDSISTDVFTSGNFYSDSFVRQYFDSNGDPISNGLLGEEVPSVVAFIASSNLMKRAVTNQLNKKDLTISAGVDIFGASGDPQPVLASGNPNACVDVQSNIDNLVGIVTSAISFGTIQLIPSNTNSLSLGKFSLVSGGSTISPGGFKCARDIGFLADAISTDVFTGGNSYSREFILQYFDANGDPLLDGLYEEEVPSFVAFSASSELMKKAVTNQLYAKNLGISSGPQLFGGEGDSELVLQSGNANACLDVQDNIDTLIGIVTSVVGLGTTATSSDVTTEVNFGFFAQSGIGTTSSPGGFKCARDIGFLVDAISTDVFVGGNVYATEFTLQYFDNSGNPISNGLVGEETQSVVAFGAASDLMKRAVTNQLNSKDVGISSGKSVYAGAGTSIPVLISGNSLACLDVQGNIENLVGIVTVSVGLGTTTTLPTGNSLNRGLFTLNVDSFTKQTLNRVSYGEISPGGQKCSRDLGYLVDAVATDVFTGGNSYSIAFSNFYFDEEGNPRSDALLGEEDPSVVSFIALGDFAKKAVTNQLNRKDVGISSGPQLFGGEGDSELVLQSGNANACLDVQDNIDTLVAITTEAIGIGTTTAFPEVNLGIFNQTGTASTITPGGFKCARDLGFLRFAISEDVFTGGNRRTVGFALSYFDANGDPISNGLVGEEIESVTAFTAFGQLSKAAVTNQLNSQDLTISPDYLTGDNRSPESCADVQDLIENLIGITTTAVGLGTTTVLPEPFKGFDERDDEQYRFFDSYRLIQQNRQEIIDRSIGEIAVGYDAYDTFFFPGDAEENERSRYYDAYRLIQLNKDVIVGLAFTDAVNEPAFSAFDFASVEDKCKRDTAFFIDAISLDALTGGNIYSREFTLQYFDNGSLITNGLDGEVSESIYVFEAALGYMKNAITNSLVGATYTDTTISIGGTYYNVGSDVPNDDSTACLDIQDNLDTLAGIVTVSLGAGSIASLPEVTEGYFSQSVGLGTTNTPGGFKCARDVGFFIDSISTDIFIAGNKYSQEFILQYFDANESAIYIDGTEVIPTVVGLAGAGEFMKGALTNQLYRKDLTISAGPSYYESGDEDVPVLQSGNSNACLDVQDNVDTLVGIVTMSLNQGDLSNLESFPLNAGIFDKSNAGVSTNNPGGYKCGRDLGFLIDSVSTDVFTGGNIYSRGFSEQYFNADGTPIRGGLEGEEAPSLTAFRSSSDLMRRAVTNQLYIKDLTLSFGPSEFGGSGPVIEYNASGNSDACLDVQGSIENLVGIITSVIGAGTTAELYDGTIETTLGLFTLNLGDFNQTVGFGTTSGDLSSIGLGATITPGGYKCARDIGYMVDAVSTDVFVGGNTYSISFSEQYFDSKGSPISPGLNQERLESATAFDAAGGYMRKAVTNQLYAKDLTLSFGPAYFGQETPIIIYNKSGNAETCQDVQDFIDNRVGIITSVIGIGTLSVLNTFTPNSGSFLPIESKCRRDIGFLVDAVSKDLENFTNKNTIENTNFYFDDDGNPIAPGLDTEKIESVTAFRASGSYMKLAINNQLNSKNFNLLPDILTGSNNTPDSCSNVKDTIDNLIGISTDSILTGSATTVAVSAASTFFTANVGSGPFPHYYTSGGTVKINATRPFDGQVIVVDRLYFQASGIKVIDGGSGYTNTPEINISNPTTPWGVPAQAIARVENGSVVSADIVSSGRGFTASPTLTIAPPLSGGRPARIAIELYPSYYTVSKSSLPESGVSTLTLDSQIPYEVTEGMEVYFYKQSRVLASSHAFEYIGSGIDIKTALPQNGGVTIPENETVNLNGGLVVFTSTDQSGNFKIGDGLIINQNTGTISGTAYSKSLFSTLTPFILALGGE